MQREPTILRLLSVKDPPLYHRALALRDKVAPVLRRIVQTFPHYTGHDDSHSEALVHICAWVAGDDLLDKLTGPELYVLFASFYLHDVGMVTTPEEAKELRNSPEYLELQRKNPKFEDVEVAAEIVRRRHHLRSAEIVRGDRAIFAERLIDDSGLAAATALVCESHGRSDLTDFEKYDPHSAWGLQGKTICVPLLAVLLRLSDLLHLTDDRAPLLVVPLVHLANDISRREWSKHLSTVGIAPVPAEAHIRLTCECRDVGVHRDLLRLCDWANREITFSQGILKLLRDRGLPYHIIYREIKPKIHARGYHPWHDLAFQLDRDSVLELLRGSQLYRGPAAVVHELIYNAIDATRQALKLGMGAASIKVEFSTRERSLKVSDSGIGMSEREVREFLLRMGRSFYRSPEYRDRFVAGQRIDAVSTFGIGFATCFLASERVVVETKSNASDPIILDMFDLAGFVAARPGGRTTSGTLVTCHLRDESLEPVRHAVETLYSKLRHLEIDVQVDVDGARTRIVDQPYKEKPDDFLAGYFKGKEPGFGIAYRDLDASRDGAHGAIGLLFHRVDGVMMVGGPAHYKTARIPSKHMSQLGVALPYPNGMIKSLLGICSGISDVIIDIDIRGGERLELDATRGHVQNTPGNVEITKRLDIHLITLLMELYDREWRCLGRDLRFEVFDRLGHMFFGRIIEETFFASMGHVAPIIDLLYDNMGFETRCKALGAGKRTWNEVRSLDRAVVVIQEPHWGASRPQTDALLSEAEVLAPESVIVSVPAIHRWADHLAYFADETAVLLLESHKMTALVISAWAGTAAQLIERKRQPRTGSARWLLPFWNGVGYAALSRGTLRRPTAGNAWINSQHPKVRFMLDHMRALNAADCETPRCNAFLRFLHEEHIGYRTDAAYVEYVAAEHSKALEELVQLDVAPAGSERTMLLGIQDFATWEER